MGIYSVDEAKKGIDVCRNAITHAEQELERLRQLSSAGVNAFDTGSASAHSAVNETAVFSNAT